MKHMILAQALMALADSGIPMDWDLPVRTEKSGLPVKEPMPLSEYEESMLSTLHGKAKKLFLKELREKYKQ